MAGPVTNPMNAGITKSFYLDLPLLQLKYENYNDDKKGDIINIVKIGINHGH